MDLNEKTRFLAILGDMKISTIRDLNAEADDLSEEERTEVINMADEYIERFGDITLNELAITVGFSLDDALSEMGYF